MKRILYGAGGFGKQALDIYGRDQVAFYFDKNVTEDVICGVPVLHHIDELLALQDEYVITVTVNGENIYSVWKDIKELGIKATWITLEYNTIHVTGIYPNIQYTYIKNRRTNDDTVSMIRDMFELYADDFVGKQFDFWVYTGDYAYDAYLIKTMVGAEVIFSYNTIFTEKNVVAIPDYMCYRGGVYRAYKSVEEKPYSGFEACLESGKEKWVYPKAFWSGTLNTAEVRKMLYHLYLENKEYLCVNAAIRYGNGEIEFLSGTAVSMLDFPRYKYLVCVEGYGWADRLKHLLSMRRVVLLVDYPYKEYYSHLLIPMVHYVPIKADLSDLIPKIEYLENHPDVYEVISENATIFSQEHFNREKILADMHAIMSEYL